jgi:hypothetical protein
MSPTSRKYCLIESSLVKLTDKFLVTLHVIYSFSCYKLRHLTINYQPAGAKENADHIESAERNNLSQPNNNYQSHHDIIPRVNKENGALDPSNYFKLTSTYASASSRAVR